MTEQQLITGEMTIGDIVEKYPQVAPILTGYGLHCIGCGAASFESIEAGARGHGMDEEMVQMMIKDANKVAQMDLEDTKNDSPDLKITTKAAEKVVEFKKQAGKEDHFLRIAVTEGGCSGKSYGFTLEKDQGAGDKVIEKNGVQFVLNPESFEQLRGSKVDYLESLEASGFKIHNPNAKQTCGCGSSFA